VNNKNSFYHLSQWLLEFLEKGSPSAFIFLIGTKCDLEPEIEAQEAF
jgi:GTPase SAR1 family protein